MDDSVAAEEIADPFAALAAAGIMDQAKKRSIRCTPANFSEIDP